MRRWLVRTVVMAVAVPLAAAGARRAADMIESRRGESVVTRGLRSAAGYGSRSRR